MGCCRIGCQMVSIYIYTFDKSNPFIGSVTQQEQIDTTTIQTVNAL